MIRPASLLKTQTLLEVCDEVMDDYKILLKDEFSGVKVGSEISNFGGSVFEGSYPDNGLDKKVVVHEAYDRNGLETGEWGKITNYLVAKAILEKMGLFGTAYVPEIIGHKTAYKRDDFKRHEFYVGYEPRHLPRHLENVDDVKYVSDLGRDVARFISSGMTNVPRHIRPNVNDDFRTCMIDLDGRDPGTFNWNQVDIYDFDSMEYKLLLEREKIFVDNVLDYFRIEDDTWRNMPLPKFEELKKQYYDSINQELFSIHGSSIKTNVA